MEKPKRPLSSFNLFYRYKRSLLVDKGDLPIETIKSILTCPAGLEDEILPSSSTTTATATSRSRDGNPGNNNNDNNNTKRRTKIQTELNGKLLPSNTNKKRRHRKSLNGPSLSFVELGKLMTTSWKQLDEYGKQVFDDLAGEGREIYRVALEEYNNGGGRRVESDGGASEDGSLEKVDGGKMVKQRNDGRRNSGQESGSDDDKKVVPSRVASMPRTRSGTRRSSRSSSSSEGEKEPDVVASMPMKCSGKRRSSSSSSSSGGEKEQEVASMPLTRSSSSNHFKKNEDSSSSSSSSDQSSPTSNKKRKEPTNMVSRCVKKALHERYYDHHFKTTGLDRRYEDAQDAPVPHHVSSAPACPSQEVGSSSAAAVPEDALSNNIEADFFERYADNSRGLDDADFNLYGNDIRTFFDASD